MRLSTFSDYSLRVLIYLGLRHGQLSTIAEIADAYAISSNHLMKVVHQLGRNGFIETLRGKGGGMRLAKDPKDIILGDVVRLTEQDFELVECFETHSECRIQHACALRGILQEGLDAMFLVFDGYTLADLLSKPRSLERSIIQAPTPSKHKAPSHAKS